MSSQDRAIKNNKKKRKKKKNTKIKRKCVGGDQSSLFALSDL